MGAAQAPGQGRAEQHREDNQGMLDRKLLLLVLREGSELGESEGGGGQGLKVPSVLQRMHGRNWTHKS